jgi:hypothetical protein
LTDDDRPDLGHALAGSETSAGTAAILQALMSTLGEVLERVDSRLAALEEVSTAPSPRGPSPAMEDMVNAVLVSLGRLSDRLDRLEERDPAETVMEMASPRLEALAGAVERLEARDPAEAVVPRLEDISNSVDTVAQGLAAVTDLTTTSAQQGEQWRQDLGAALSDAVVELRNDVAIQPLAGLREDVGRIEQRLADLMADLREQTASQTAALPRLDELAGAVDSLGYGMAGIADLITSSPGTEQSSAELSVALAALEDRLGAVVTQLATQPGPGPALAMVAAGLAERFEERTQALTDLLGTHAAYVHQSWERIDGMLGGGSLDELAVGEALEHVIDNQERLKDSVDRLLAGLEELRQGAEGPAEAGPRSALGEEALASLGAGMQGLGARVDDVRRRLAGLAAMLEASDQGRRGLDVEDSDSTPSMGRPPSGARKRRGSDLGLRGGRRASQPPDGGRIRREP